MRVAGRGHRFTTDTDTEVIVAAYRQWGADCVLKFNGMWAFAIWDSQDRELFLSRDRFGVKPLHYLAEPHRFVFASELKCFLQLRDFVARENHAEMRHQLTGIESPGQTLLEGVKLLRPGHNMTVSATGIRAWRWWSTLDHLVEVPRRFADQAAEFRELFFDACRLRLRSDVPIATCLSGGLDSSSILCSLAAMNAGNTERRASDFHRAFVATFEGTSHDEREYAAAAIEKAHADPRYWPMDSGALIEDLPQYAYDFEMAGQGVLLPIWALYRELRRDGVVVSLDGLGADELLMGYGVDLRNLLKTYSLLSSPLRALDLARTVQRQYPHDESVAALLAQNDTFVRNFKPFLRKLKHGIKGTRPSPGLVHDDPQWCGSWVNPADEMDASERAAMDALTPINRLLYHQFHHGVNQSLLRKYDRLSMAHGIEVRMPFLDWRVVCFAFSLPDQSKAGGGYSKRILREAMRGVLPETIRTRTEKIGFQAPLSEWMNGDLGAWAWERVQTKRFLEIEVWDGPAIRDFMAPHQAAHDWKDGNARKVWRYLQADLWREAFFDPSGIAARDSKASLLRAS